MLPVSFVCCWKKVSQPKVSWCCAKSQSGESIGRFARRNRRLEPAPRSDNCRHPAGKIGAWTLGKGTRKGLLVGRVKSRRGERACGEGWGTLRCTYRRRKGYGQRGRCSGYRSKLVLAEAGAARSKASCYLLVARETEGDEVRHFNFNQGCHLRFRWIKITRQEAATKNYHFANFAAFIG